MPASRACANGGVLWGDEAHSPQLLDDLVGFFPENLAFDLVGFCPENLAFDCFAGACAPVDDGAINVLATCAP